MTGHKLRLARTKVLYDMSTADIEGCPVIHVRLKASPDPDAVERYRLNLWVDKKDLSQFGGSYEQLAPILQGLLWALDQHEETL